MNAGARRAHWTRRAWLATGWAGLGTVVWLGLTPNPAPLGTELYWGAHAGAFASLYWWFAQALPAGRRVWLMLALLALGVGIEALQGLGGVRAMHWSDVVANTAGLLLGWLALRFSGARVLQRLQRA